MARITLKIFSRKRRLPHTWGIRQSYGVHSPLRFIASCEREHPWERTGLKSPASCGRRQTSAPSTANGSYASSSGSSIRPAAIGAYYLLVINYVIENAPGVTWILAAIAAIFLESVRNKFSKTHRAYTGYLAELGLTNEDVVEFLKTNGRDNPRA